MYVKHIIIALLICIPHFANAELVSLSDEELADTTGQSIVDIVELIDPSQGNDGFRFLRIRTGAEVRINANIDRVELGRQYRNDPYVASYCPTVGDHSCSAATRVTQTLPNGEDGNAYTFSQTDGTPQADVIIDNLSLGRALGSSLEPVTMINPYLEFVFDEETNAMIGFRTGAERQDGSIGNASQSGACSVTNLFGNNSNCAGILSLSGNLFLDVQIAEAFVNNVSRATATPLQNILGGFLDPILGGLENSVQALGDLPSNNTQEFFLSLNTRPIVYPQAGLDGDPNRLRTLNGNRLGGVPGFSLNVTDGVQAPGFVALISGVPKASNCFNGSLGPC